MKMDCPHCGVNGTVDDSLVGRKVRCPKCSDTFVVQAASTSPIEVEAMELEEYGGGESLARDNGFDDAINDVDISDLLRSDANEDEFPTGTCIACGKSVHPALLMEIGSKMYCAGCVPEQALFDDEMESGEDTSADVAIEPLLAGSSSEQAELAPKNEKEKKSGIFLKLLILFVIIALAGAATIFLMDIKLI